MLISFEPKNFLSFGFDNTSFTMATGKARGKREHVIVDKKIQLLRFASLYGSNSSGKSNFVKAIKFAQNIILEGIKNDFKITQYYNRSHEENAKKTTEFKFQFLIHKKIYTYEIGMLLNSRQFVFEKLACNDKSVFSRDLQNQAYDINITCKNPEKKAKVNMFFDTIKNLDDVLFLKDMNLNKASLYDEQDEISIFNDLYNVFKQSLKIVTPTTRVSNEKILFTEEKKVEKVLQQFGFDITQLIYKEDTRENVFRGFPQELIDELMNQINQQLVEEDLADVVLHGPNGIVKISCENGELKLSSLHCKHGNNVAFAISEESDGLRRLLDLIGIILDPQENDIYIVDELDRSFNAILSRNFINYYLNKTLPRTAQLIITTHETRLLDLNMLRKDEIWLFDRNQGNTEIVALTDFPGNIRSDVKLDAAYMDGRYGGIPKPFKG